MTEACVCIKLYIRHKIILYFKHVVFDMLCVRIKVSRYIFLSIAVSYCTVIPNIPDGTSMLLDFLYFSKILQWRHGQCCKKYFSVYENNWRWPSKHFMCIRLSHTYTLETIWVSINVIAFASKQLTVKCWNDTPDQYGHIIQCVFKLESFTTLLQRSGGRDCKEKPKQRGKEKA